MKSAEQEVAAGDGELSKSRLEGAVPTRPEAAAADDEPSKSKLEAAMGSAEREAAAPDGNLSKREKHEAAIRASKSSLSLKERECPP